MNFVQHPNQNYPNSKFETNQNNKYRKSTLGNKKEASRQPQSLELRTMQFAKDCRQFVGQIPMNITIIDDAKQLLRSSGSVGANYLEANEKLSQKDLILRLKISKKEAKESRYWLQLIRESISQSEECDRLVDESTQLMNILGAIILKCSPHTDSAGGPAR
jgi:four helix bundle protein